MFRLAALMAASALPLAAMPPASAEEGSGSLAPVVARVAQSVVRVDAWRKPAPSPYAGDPAFERFFGTARAEREERDGRSDSATAFVVDAEAGLLVTTDYVVRDASRVEVRLGSGETRAASVVGHDEASGIGLLRVAPGGLTAVAWSESEAAIGDAALLVGYAFKLGPIVTAGIVAGRDQAVANADFSSLLLDIAVNKGAAGGVVTTLDGRLIGMAYGNYGTGAEPYANLGLAVPAAEMRPIIAALAADGRVRRGRIGVTIEPVRFGRGVRITGIDKNSPAERAGLRVDEEIIALNGEAVASDRALRLSIARAPVGTTLTLRVRDEDADERDVSLVTEDRVD